MLEICIDEIFKILSRLATFKKFGATGNITLWKTLLATSSKALKKSFKDLNKKIVINLEF